MVKNHVNFTYCDSLSNGNLCKLSQYQFIIVGYLMTVYSQSFRFKVLKYREKHNLSITKTAKHFNLNIATLRRWVRSPIIEVIKRSRVCTKIDMEALKSNVKDQPTLILKDRAALFNVSIGGICGAFKRLNITKVCNPYYMIDGHFFRYVVGD